MTPTPEEIAAVESLVEPMVEHGTEYESAPTVLEMALRYRALMAERDAELATLREIFDEMAFIAITHPHLWPAKATAYLEARSDSARRAEARG